MRKLIAGSLILAAFLVLFALALPSGVSAQAASCADGVDFGGFTICFLGLTDNGDDTSTFTYSVTSDSDSTTPALSHWTMELCKTAFIGLLSPTTAYTTFSPYDAATGRDGIDYEVVRGSDTDLGIFGVRFQDAPISLGENGAVETDIFQITLEGQWQVTPRAAGVMAGTGTYLGLIPGPDCSPTAVTISASQVAAQPNTGLYALLALVAAAGFVTIVAIARQKQVTAQV